MIINLHCAFFKNSEKKCFNILMFYKENTRFMFTTDFKNRSIYMHFFIWSDWCPVLLQLKETIM